MNKSIFPSMVGRKLSVMITPLKPGSTTCESYIGILESVGEDYIVLHYDLSDKNIYGIDKVVLSCDIIMSLWIFKA